ncbi:bifunctional peptidase and arginyl-hydroxylase JMJD5-like [Rhagoletis pomonella]|uniref:bifunctional peptidase and arginyl-hydroxylase JMJD5-like n=1 Tax=Rhagoletis pomonella TaxID=28610 RepID=UPI00177BF825|nr:bifunctional peptidase and arginyl-hydroxylase JMJD5-like [Rhagoletis pomonella]
MVNMQSGNIKIQLTQGCYLAISCSTKINNWKLETKHWRDAQSQKERMEDWTKIAEYLPKYEEIKNILQSEPEADYIIREAAADVGKTNEEREFNDEIFYLVSSLADKFWERIHTGHFSAVPIEVRKIYALACYYKIYYLFCESLSKTQLLRCSEILDEAILIGCTQSLYKGSDQFQTQLTSYISKVSEDNAERYLPIIAELERQQYKCDIPVLDCPSVENFHKICFNSEQPALLLNTIAHWPAMHKWRDLNYLHKLAGNRTVPIEIGANYTTDEWSQQLVKIRDFLRRQFVQSNTQIEYLAQHELFDQIPALKTDIRIPDYCILHSSGNSSDPEKVSIKAWLGPKNTISPLHYDPEHNLLCQVFGRKQVILAAPTDTAKLYPHDSEMLCNTSKLDATRLDLERFPLAAEVAFYNVTLQVGDCLYIPPKWWHYVRAESESFSVSFWWS